MNFGPPPYISGSENKIILPLDRFLPPYQSGILAGMLQFREIKNGWILDPLGNQPLSAIELAQSGYRVFVACNNPILARIFEVLCLAPGYSEFQAALSEFGSLKLAEDRLENQIKSLYETSCPTCHAVVDQVSYLWEREANSPYKRDLHCHACGTEGLFDLDEKDLTNILKTGNINLHRSRALQKVLPGFNQPPEAVIEVIETYLPRSLSVITRLINKNDGYQTTTLRKKIIESLLILACDYGSMTWGIGSGQNRPKLVSIPGQFREYNLWKILENGYKQLSLLDQPLPFTFYPELPPESGGICFYPNRIRHREELVNLPDFKAVATVLPRPNQAFWTYSAVWAGWLWGPEAANQLKGALERRRYDWLWHTFALRKLFEFTMEDETPWLAVAPELTSGYTFSYLSAASSTGYSLINRAINYQHKTAQFYWYQGKAENATNKKDIHHCIQEYLHNKGESANYQELFTIFLTELANSERFPRTLNEINNTLLLKIQKDFENIIKDQNYIKKIDQDTLEYGEFWLTNPPLKYRPLADQIELSFIRYLHKDPIVSFSEIESAINQQQPGVFPVGHEYLNKLLISYCDPIPGMDNTWQIRLQESINIRRADIRLINSLLIEMGTRMNIDVEKEPTVLWNASESGKSYRFFVSASCIFSRFYDSHFDSDEYETVIVYPGSRAELLNYKLKQNPVFKTKVSKVHFVKYRYIRQLSKDTQLNLFDWARLLDGDPAVLQNYNQPVLF